MQNHPLNKVVFIQKVAAFTRTHQFPIKDLFRLAYVNNAWNDTIKNYSFHLFEQKVSDIGSDTQTLDYVFGRVIKCDVIWFAEVLLFSQTALGRANVSMLVCKNASLGMMHFVFEKIVTVGGTDVLKSQFNATRNDSGRNCLMIHLCFQNSSSQEAMRLIFAKIDEAGGKEFLTSQVTATDYFGMNCLMLGCAHSKSAKVMKLICEKIVEADGAVLLKRQLAATNRSGYNCLMLGFMQCSSSEVLKFLAVVLFELDLFKQQYKTACDVYRGQAILREKAEINDASWAPDPESIAEVNKILKRSDQSQREI